MENNKKTNRELIALLTNEMKHVLRRLDRIEWWLGGLVLAYVAGFITVIIKVAFG